MGHYGRFGLRLALPCIIGPFEAGGMEKVAEVLGSIDPVPGFCRLALGPAINNLKRFIRCVMLLALDFSFILFYIL